ELLLAQQLPAAGRFELPALAVDSGGGHGGVPFPPPSRRTRSCQGTNMMLERARLRLAMRVAILAPLVAVCSGRAPGPDEANSVQTVPSGVILVKGAWASASDATTPVPEGGAIANTVYTNAYFGLTYPLSRDWVEKYD